MGDVIFFSAVKAQRQADALLDELAMVRRCAVDLSHGEDGPVRMAAEALVALTDRLAHIGIEQIGTAIVMREDFDRRMRQLAAVAPASHPGRPRRQAAAPLPAALEA